MSKQWWTEDDVERVAEALWDLDDPACSWREAIDPGHRFQIVRDKAEGYRVRARAALAAMPVPVSLEGLLDGHDVKLIEWGEGSQDWMVSVAPRGSRDVYAEGTAFAPTINEAIRAAVASAKAGAE